MKKLCRVLTWMVRIGMVYCLYFLMTEGRNDSGETEESC